jgi:hypothetical protein
METWVNVRTVKEISDDNVLIDIWLSLNDLIGMFEEAAAQDDPNVSLRKAMQALVRMRDEQVGQPVEGSDDSDETALRTDGP